MRFFIPATEKEQTEDFYNNTIVRYIESLGFQLLKANRIYRLSYMYNGNNLSDSVGQNCGLNGEPIFAILETDEIFLICTTNRGIIGETPLQLEKEFVDDIEYFDMSRRNFYKYGEWEYMLDENYNHDVDFPKEEPDNLFKYFKNNEDNIDALINGYLFCSHPYHFNDSMDCSNMLWDFSKITEKRYNRFFEYYSNEKFIKKEVDFEIDKVANFINIKLQLWNYVTNSSGVISLTEKPLHILMWAHYATEKGFMVEFDRAEFIWRLGSNNPKIRNYVFMPVQYVDELEPIDFFAKEFESPDVPYLYILNVKRKAWEYENEWRLVCYSEGYGVPNSILTPSSEDILGKVERKVFYDRNTIKAITLGKHFFNGDNLIYLDNSNVFSIKEEEKQLKFVQFLFDNFNDRLFWCGEYQVGSKFERNRNKIQLEKLEHNVFKILEV